MKEQNVSVTFKGSPLTLIGEGPAIGDDAPDAVLIANDLSPVHLTDYRGKTCVLASVPSLDTSVCDAETRRFNTEAGKLGDSVRVLTISMDLPFAQARWCGQAGIDRVRTLSDHRDAAFGRAYGLLIRELRLLARAVHVVGADGIVRYRQIVGELTDEPDYDDVLDAVAKLT